MDKVRYGIIGVGNQGTNYLANIFLKGEAEGACVTAICDINPKKLDHAKDLINSDDVAVFTDYKQLIDSGLVDAVMIETPHYIHPEIAIYALKKGIHVLCDKPEGVYTKQVQELNEVAISSNALFGMMFNQRTNCVYRKMREMVLGGKIGKLQRVTWIITDWFRSQFYYDMGSWRATWRGEGGGVLLNQCPHQLDLLQWVVGEMPSSVRAICKYGKWHNIEVEDDVTAYLSYKSGATGVFITTTGETPGTNRFEISGSKGKLLCEDGKLYFYENDIDSIECCKTSQEAFPSVKVTKTEVETDGQNPQHAGIIRNFTQAILKKEELFVDGKEGANMVELMNAIELSGWNNGEEIKLPLDGERYFKELSAHMQKSVYKEGNDDGVADTSTSFGVK